ncbi:hypothetical protein OG352_05125 [Streptomyces sp. NBC_01485]|uniref:hypothetical protein n=1 Tax=Streptomyces sp. NBC_01485 TaxID=2903884 RepID=UPI002E2FB094|nr:hypothetical protein [Streptomyces sp. NBC_01485]
MTTPALFTSFMRTVVPIAAGLVLSWLARTGLNVFDSATVTMWVTSGLTAAYYAVFRLLEAGAGRIGWSWLRKAAGVLLGWARPPQYPAEPTGGTTNVTAL